MNVFPYIELISQKAKLMSIYKVTTLQTLEWPTFRCSIQLYWKIHVKTGDHNVYKVWTKWVTNVWTFMIKLNTLM